MPGGRVWKVRWLYVNSSHPTRPGSYDYLEPQYDSPIPSVQYALSHYRMKDALRKEPAYITLSTFTLSLYDTIQGLHYEGPRCMFTSMLMVIGGVGNSDEQLNDGHSVGNGTWYTWNFLFTCPVCLSVLSDYPSKKDIRFSPWDTFCSSEFQRRELCNLVCLLGGFSATGGD